MGELKQSFFEDNIDYSEISAEETNAVRGFQDIDEEKDEIWFLQIPKGLDVQILENQKLKFPGRIKVGEYEATALEAEAQRKMAFGYARKHNYQVKLLPIAGKIVLRKQMSGPKNIGAANIEDSSQLTSVPMPEYIKLRHPLLGAKFDEYIKSTANANCKQIAKRTIKVECSPVKRSHPTGTTKESSKKLKEMQSDDQRKKLSSKDLDVSDDLKWIKEL